MSDDIERINEIFRIHDEQISSTDAAAEPASASKSAKGKSAGAKSGSKNKEDPIKKVDRFLTDSDGKEQRNYTGDAESERDYRPVRQSHVFRLHRVHQHRPGLHGMDGGKRYARSQQGGV